MSEAAGCHKACFNRLRCVVGWSDGTCGRRPKGEQWPRLTRKFWERQNDPELIFRSALPLMTGYQVRMIHVGIYRAIKPHTEENEKSALFWESDKFSNRSWQTTSIVGWISICPIASSMFIQGSKVHAPTGSEACQIIRCIAGYPWETPKPWVPTDAVAQLAEVIALHESYQDLPLLADAADEAGFDDENVLAHLRSGAIHTKGCHALQLLRRA